MNRTFSLRSISALLVTQSVSAVASACPACAGRADSHPWATAALIASLISMPYIIGAVVVRAVRKLDSADAAANTDGSNPQ